MSPQPFVLSVMQAEQIRPCADIFTAVFTGPPWNNPNVTTEKAVRYLRDLMRTPGFLGFVYARGEDIVGMVLGTISDYFFDPQYKIEELAVDPACHRQGLGSKMLLETEQYLAERDVTHMILQTSATIPAYDFYRRNGYAVVEDTVCMMKGL